MLFADEVCRARSSLAQVVLQVLAFFTWCTYRIVCSIGIWRCEYLRLIDGKTFSVSPLRVGGCCYAFLQKIHRAHSLVAGSDMVALPSSQAFARQLSVQPRVLRLCF